MICRFVQELAYKSNIPEVGKAEIARNGEHDLARKLCKQVDSRVVMSRSHGC